MSNDKILEKYKLDPNKLFYTTKEICELIDRSNVLLTAYRSKGVLGDPVKLVAKKFMFDKATVEAFLIEFEDQVRGPTSLPSCTSCAATSSARAANWPNGCRASGRR